ncbi:MAG: adenylate/guanylate cyclase domain-containing protein [Halioglobus sp.]|jgi:adenylate cyclase|nr:adenylate/guanylate cyclase domain-containing protein [Halioglobus sp.]
MQLSALPTLLANSLQKLPPIRPRDGRLLVLLLAGILAVALNFAFSDALKTVEERLGVMGWTLTTDDAIEERITLVTIDEKSLAEVGPWPWPRQELARLVNAIDEAGAQLQIHDVFLAEPKDGDAGLVAALESSRGAVLAQVPILQSEQTARVGAMSHALTAVSCGAQPPGASSGISLPSTQNYIASHAGFSAISKGHITPIVASDGSIRQFPALICVDGMPYPALAISALLEATNSVDWNASVRADRSFFGPEFRLQLDAYPGLNIPLDSQGNIRISYKQAPNNFRAVSASDVMSGNIEPGLFENTWVLVGATALSMGDIVPTPYSGATPGVELQARILSSLLDAQMPYTPRSANWLLGFISICIALVLLKLAAAPARVSAYGLPIAGVVFPVLVLTLHIQMLSSSEVWMGWLFPALYSLLAASLLLLLEQSRVRVERSRVYGNLSSYLPLDIAKEIAYTLPSSAINAKRCDVTLLSADLRNFAAFSESRPPEESAAVLHFFFVRATAIVEQHGGRVHEFKGDSVLAVWDGQHREAALQALQAAQGMQEAIDQDMLTPQSASHLEPLALGIGIEQGPALIGSIGPAHRRSHSLLGDTVTITLRVQELTEELAQPILIGECAARQLNDQQLISQGSYLLSGLRIPHTLFAPAISELAQGKKKSTKRMPPKLKVVAGNRD